MQSRLDFVPGLYSYPVTSKAVPQRNRTLSLIIGVFMDIIRAAVVIEDGISILFFFINVVSAVRL